MEELTSLIDAGWQVGFLSEVRRDGDAYNTAVYWKGKYDGKEYVGKWRVFAAEAVRDFMDFAHKTMNGTSTDVVVE